MRAGVCNLCNGAVDFMLDHDREGRFRMAALQSPAGRTLLESCGRKPDDISSIVLVEPDQHYTKSCARAPTLCLCTLSQPSCLQLSQRQSRPAYPGRSTVLMPCCRDAVLRIARGLGLPMQALSAAALPLPLLIRDTFYDQIANNRSVPSGSAPVSAQHMRRGLHSEKCTDVCDPCRYRLLGKKDTCRCVCLGTHFNRHWYVIHSTDIDFMLCRLSDERFTERFIAD